MIIGIDGIPLGQVKTGVGHYTYEIALGVARHSPSDRYEVLSHIPYDATAIGAAEAQLDNLKFIESNVNWLTKRWWTIGLPRYLKKHHIDLFHGTNYDVPILSPCPTVLTIHDLSLLLHSGTHEERRVRRARYRLPLMARRATLIIVPTLSVRNEVGRHLGISLEKVRVVREAARRSFGPVSNAQSIAVKKRLGVEEQFILFVGTIEPRKNVITLLRAFEEIVKANNLRVQLVLAGKPGWLTEEFFAHLAQSRARERILLTGYLQDEELKALYSSCLMMVFPAIYEGAGLPPLEAMACGAPVITSDTPAIAEMVADAARLFPPLDHHALARHIFELLNDAGKRAELTKRGLDRAAQFTWEEAAKLTYNAYEEAMEMSNKQQKPARYNRGGLRAN